MGNATCGWHFPFSLESTASVWVLMEPLSGLIGFSVCRFKKLDEGGRQATIFGPSRCPRKNDEGLPGVPQRAPIPHCAAVQAIRRRDSRLIFSIPRIDEPKHSDA